MEPKIKRANEYFGIEEADYFKTGAFNPVIGVDSLFFIDPLLLGKTKVPEFEGSLDEVRTYFSAVITLIKTKNRMALIKARRKMTLREVRGMGIGYGNVSDDGSAIGPELAGRLVNSASDLIEMGVADPAIFEVMGMFERDFGPDRLSDGLARILIERLFAYSHRVTKELAITETVTTTINEHEYVLARHPLKSNPIIFIPADILRAIPVANSYDEIHSVASFNEELRDRFNKLIAPCFKGKNKKPPTKSEIKQYLFQKKARIATLVETYQSCDPKSYDFKTDPEGRHLWLEKAKDIVLGNPVSVPELVKEEELEAVVVKIITSFKKFVETKGGWRSLYDNNLNPLNERHAANLFYAMSSLYCEGSNVDVSPQSNAGQGPVDFKLSRGSAEKILVEVKLTSGNVKHGYEKQTRIYQESEDAHKSFFLVVQNTEKSKSLDEIIKIQELEEKAGKPHPTIVSVDGRIKKSASRA